MAQEVIQKDLGLVTAYGYALAGGYTGTEEQFAQDFAALMSGQYTALGNKPSINGITLTGDKTTSDIIPLDSETLEVDASGLLTVIGGGSSVDYERIDIVSSFSNGINLENGTINHVYVNRYGRITFLDIRAETNTDIIMVPGGNHYFFKVSTFAKKAIPYQNCPIVGYFIINGGGIGQRIDCTINYDDGNFYISDISESVTINSNVANNMQVQCAFINSNEG